jgi:hypothetical protein
VRGDLGSHGSRSQYGSFFSRLSWRVIILNEYSFSK